MKRIILSLAVIAAVSAAVVSATGAFFSDTETSQGNTFAAGSIQLAVDNTAHYDGMICAKEQGTDNYVWQEESTGSSTYPELLGKDCTNLSWAEGDFGPTSKLFNFTDLKPGDTGEDTVSLHVTSNDAYACAIIDNVENNDNGITDPESKAGDTTDGVGNGELAQNMQFMVWEDDGDNIHQSNEPILLEGSGDGILPDGKVFPLNTPANGALTAGQTRYLGVAWCFGTWLGDGTCDGSQETNITQTDSLSADISFYAEQARNNDNFTCPSLQETPTLSVGEGEGWASNASTQTWFAKSKVQEPNPASDFEVQLGIGDSSPSQFDQGDTVYPNNQAVPFTLTYDGSGNASFTVNGVATNYAVGTTSISNLGITLKAPTDATTNVDNLSLSTGSLSTTSASITNGTYHLMVTGANLDGGFTLTGNITYTWNTLTSNGEDQKVQISVD